MQIGSTHLVGSSSLKHFLKYYFNVGEKEGGDHVLSECYNAPLY